MKHASKSCPRFGMNTTQKRVRSFMRARARAIKQGGQGKGKGKQEGQGKGKGKGKQEGKGKGKTINYYLSAGLFSSRWFFP